MDGESNASSETNENIDVMVKDMIGKENGKEIKKELLDDASRNPKRKQLSFPLGDEMSTKSSNDGLSLGNHVRNQERVSGNLKKEENAEKFKNSDMEASGNNDLRPIIKQERFEENDISDNMFSEINIKKEPNTTFSQIEEVIELDSDGEDPAYQLWCSSQIEFSSTSSKNVKQERIEIEDAFSIASFDSPIQSSPKYDLLESTIQPHPEEDGSDDDVIFLECDNKHLDLEGSQMALFEKIRQNIKVKKEKVDSQQEDMNHIDIINLASPPNHKDDDIITLSPIGPPDQDSKQNIVRKDKDSEKRSYNQNEKSPTFDQIDPFSEPYSPTEELPDLEFSSENRSDQGLKSPYFTSHDTKDKSKERIHPSTSRVTPPISPMKKRPIQLIEPLPQPPKKHARKTSTSSERGEGDIRPKHFHHQDNKNEKEWEGNKDKWKSSHKSYSSGLSHKEKRSDALKEIELRKKEQKHSEIGAANENDGKIVPSTSSKPATAALTKVKTSKPKLQKLFSTAKSSKDSNLFDDGQTSPRQPVRKAHKPKRLPPSLSSSTNKAISTSSTSATKTKKIPPKAVNTSHPTLLTKHVRTTAETTLDQ